MMKKAYLIGFFYACNFLNPVITESQLDRIVSRDGVSPWRSFGDWWPSPLAAGIPLGGQSGPQRALKGEAARSTCGLCGLPLLDIALQKKSRTNFDE